jgi:hypothetical protein
MEGFSAVTRQEKEKKMMLKSSRKCISCTASQSGMRSTKSMAFLSITHTYLCSYSYYFSYCSSVQIQNANQHGAFPEEIENELLVVQCVYDRGLEENDEALSVYHVATPSRLNGAKQFTPLQTTRSRILSSVRQVGSLSLLVVHSTCSLFCQCRWWSR